MSRLLTPCLLVALLLACASPLQADRKPGPKDPYAVIAGTVYGPQNNLIFGVKVKLRHADSKKSLEEAYSDHMGEFAFRVPAGPADYIVWPDLKDKAAAERYAVKVSISNEERQDIGIHLKALDAR